MQWFCIGLSVEKSLISGLLGQATLINPHRHIGSLRKMGIIQGCEVCKYCTVYSTCTSLHVQVYSVMFTGCIIRICSVQSVKAQSNVIQQTLWYSLQSCNTVSKLSTVCQWNLNLNAMEACIMSSK